MARGKVADEEMALAAARVKARIVNSLAAEFYARRQELGMCEGDIAALIGSSQSRVSALERAEGNPTVDTIARVAAALDLEVEVTVRVALIRTQESAADVSTARKPRQTRHRLVAEAPAPEAYARHS